MDERYSRTDEEMEAMAEQRAIEVLKDTYAGAYDVLKTMALEEVRTEHRRGKSLLKPKGLNPVKVLRKVMK